MIGGDKREYGPVDAELIRDWIREGRADGGTLLRAENEADWRPLWTFADFQSETASPSLPGGPPPLPSFTPISSEPNNVQVSVGHAFARAWHLTAEHFGSVASASLLVWLIFTAFTFVSCFGLLPMLFYGPLLGGLFMFFLKLIRTGEASAADVFALTREKFMPLMVTGIVSLLLVQIGVLLCCIPGIYLQVAWLFGLPLVADRGLGFWDALELSRRAATRHWFKLFALCILAFLPFVVFDSYLVGRQINDQAPYMKKAWAMMQQVMTGAAPNEADLRKIVEEAQAVESSYASWALFRQFLLLISLPFGIGSLAFVYEDLFGRKK